MGVHRRPRRRRTRHDRRPHAPRVGDGRPRVLRRAAVAEDVRGRRPGRDRRHRGRARARRRVRRQRARPRTDGAVVDLPRDPEPAARRDRARPRQRAHDDHHRLPRRARRAARAPRRTSCPSPSSRSVIRLARSGGRSATRSRATRTASATACRGPATPDRAPTSVGVRLRLRVLRVLLAHDEHRARRVP